PVDEAAGGAPVGRGWKLHLILPGVLDVRELLDAAVLAPALRGSVLVEHQRRVRPVREDALLLDLAVVDASDPALRMPADAPATAEDAAVALDQVRERVPGIRPQLPDGELSHRRLLTPPAGTGYWVTSLDASARGP